VINAFQLILITADNSSKKSKKAKTDSSDTSSDSDSSGSDMSDIDLGLGSDSIQIFRVFLVKTFEQSKN
jgi:hypothetical protein